MAFTTALIVDDSKLARITLRKKLEAQGIKAGMAESAAQAYELLKTDPPEVVFMDHLMPDIDGFEATQAIRNMPDFKALPIIMCTGKEHEGYLQEAQAIGANFILSKPPSDEALREVLAMDFGVTEALLTQSSSEPELEPELEIEIKPDPEPHIEPVPAPMSAQQADPIAFAIEEAKLTELVQAQCLQSISAAKEQLIADVIRALPVVEPVSIDVQAIKTDISSAVDQQLLIINEQLQVSIMADVHQLIEEKVAAVLTSMPASLTEQDVGRMIANSASESSGQQAQSFEEQLLQQQQLLLQEIHIVKASAEGLVNEALDKIDNNDDQQPLLDDIAVLQAQQAQFSGSMSLPKGLSIVALLLATAACAGLAYLQFLA